MALLLVPLSFVFVAATIIVVLLLGVGCCLLCPFIDFVQCVFSLSSTMYCALFFFSCCVFYLCRLYVFDLIENSVCNTIKHLLGAMNEYWSEATTQQNAFMVRDSAMKNLVRTQNICEWCKIYIVLFTFLFHPLQMSLLALAKMMNAKLRN